MINLKMTVAYDGFRYDGWQKQNNTANTIQGKIESVLTKVVNQSVEINGAGRTDGGVHARGQVFNCRLDESLFTITFSESRQLCRHILTQINHRLPQDIRILNVELADLRFHARLNAVGKHYSYTIDNAEVADVFVRKYVARIEPKLNIDKMNNGAVFFVGKHDFACCCTKSKLKKSTVRTITSIDITDNNGLVKIDFYGDGFLYNMVRIIVGTLIEVGLNERKAEDISHILECGKRSDFGFLAPASGLCLEEVFY